MPACSDSASMQDHDPAVAAAAAILRRGGLVVYPTETLYGLGADAFNRKALERLVRIKGREAGKPIAVLVRDLDMLDQVAAEIPKTAELLAQRFWPGPLTIVFAARAHLSELLTGGSGSIGVRVSSHPRAAALVRALDKPLTAPSANPAGQPPPRSIDAARRYFGDNVDYYLDDEILPGEPASTIVDVRGRVRIVRHGAIAAAAIAAVVRDGRAPA